MDKAAAWAEVLRPVPIPYLRAAYDRAALDHPGTYAPTAYEVLRGWIKVGEEHADQHIAEHARINAAYASLPAPVQAPPRPAQTLPALLAEVAAEIGRPVGFLQLLQAHQALRRRDPQATVAEWRARFAAARAMDSAPSLKSLIDALTRDTPSEGEAS